MSSYVAVLTDIMSKYMESNCHDCHLPGMITDSFNELLYTVKNLKYFVPFIQGM